VTARVQAERRSRLRAIAPIACGAAALLAGAPMALGQACVPGYEGIPPLVFDVDEADAWAAPPLAPLSPGEAHIIITNNLEDRLSVLDLAGVERGDLRVLASVPVGVVPVEREGPHHVTADAAGAFYYVGISNFVPAGGSGPHGAHGDGTADGHVMQVRAADNVTVGSVRVDPNPGDVRLTPDGKRLLVSHFDIKKISDAFSRGAVPPGADLDARLAVIDVATMQREAMITLCPGGHGIAISADGATAFVTCVSDELAVVDLSAQPIAVRRVPVIEAPGSAAAPKCYPYAVTLSPDAASAWVSCNVSREVLRYDVATGAMDAASKVALNGQAMFGAFTRDGATLVIPTQDIDAVAFIDAATRKVTRHKLVVPTQCQRPHVARFTDDEAKLLLVCEGNHAEPGTLVVMDVATQEVTQTAALGLYPDDIAIARRAP